MTIRISSGLSDAMIGHYGLGIMMQGGHIRIYSGPPPATADEPPTGTLLATVTADGLPAGSSGAGLFFRYGLEHGAINDSENWRMKGVATGTAGWWRFVWASPDDGTQSDYLPRIDGTVGDALALPTANITTATDQPARFRLALPTQ